MATGTFTGMKTGNDQGSHPGARNGARAGNTLYGKAMERLQRLTPGQRAIGITAAILLVLAVSLCYFCIKTSAYVPLYEGSKLTDEDSRLITGKLGEMEINYSTQGGNGTIMVPPAARNRARIELALFGLPHRTLQSTGENSTMPPGREEREDRSRLELQNMLVQSIREIDGISDAYVQIVFQQGEQNHRVNHGQASPWRHPGPLPGEGNHPPGRLFGQEP
jgi:flagellar biosynthesis/type III secretory pathway M-ring protein FliF/YscJ